MEPGMHLISAVPACVSLEEAQELRSAGRPCTTHAFHRPCGSGDEGTGDFGFLPGGG